MRHTRNTPDTSTPLMAVALFAVGLPIYLAAGGIGSLLLLAVLLPLAFVAWRASDPARTRR